MQQMLERALPAVAAWGPAVLSVLIALTLAGVWALGRGRPFLVPASWPARVLSAALLSSVLMMGLCLFVLLGPMRPMLTQVRSITGVVGRPAGDLAFREVADDRPRHLGELRDRVVLLNLWATWCPPCRRELPDVDRLQRAYAERGLVVVTLSSEDRERLLAFGVRHPVSTLNVYTDELGWLDVSGRPVSVLIDRGGTVRECLIGARTYAELEREVVKYIGSPS